MSTEVTLKQTEPRTVAFITVKGPFDQIEGTFGRLFGWVIEKGYAPVGPPLGLYFNSPEQVPPEELLWELQCPLPDAPAGGVDDAQKIHVIVWIGDDLEVGQDILDLLSLEEAHPPGDLIEEILANEGLFDRPGLAVGAH